MNIQGEDNIGRRNLKEHREDHILVEDEARGESRVSEEFNARWK